MHGEIMTKAERERFYESKRWKDKSRIILKRDGYLCQLSKRYGRTVEAEVVHHIYPVEFYPEYAYASWNLISVSRREHNKLHDRVTHELTDYGRQLMNRTRTPPGC